MAGLTSVFNFLIVYVNVFVTFIFGGVFSSNEFTVTEQREIANGILSSLTVNSSIEFEGQPILMIIIGVFVLGSIISLVRRLIKG